jgi:hypothetical protein
MGKSAYTQYSYGSLADGLHYGYASVARPARVVETNSVITILTYMTLTMQRCIMHDERDHTQRERHSMSRRCGDYDREQVRKRSD